MARAVRGMTPPYHTLPIPSISVMSPFSAPLRTSPRPPRREQHRPRDAAGRRQQRVSHSLPSRSTFSGSIPVSAPTCFQGQRGTGTVFGGRDRWSGSVEDAENGASPRLVGTQEREWTHFLRSEGKPVRCYRWRFAAALAVGRLCRLRRRAVLCRAIRSRVPRARRATCRFLCVGRSGGTFCSMPFTAGRNRRISANRRRFLRTSFDLFSASGSVLT